MKRTAWFCPINGEGQESLLMMKLALILLFAVNMAVSASPPRHESDPQQQEIVITGQVTDATTGEALPGVNIIVEGTGLGEITNDEGNYSIWVPGESAILVFSYVSYTSQSVSVGAQRVINIVMSPEIQSMEEVVVIGYGTIKKSDLTGAVSSIKQAEIEKAAPVNVISAIQGRATGVHISQNSGAPGAEPVVRIRGTGTVNTAAPIYVIDGVIMDNSEEQNIANKINFLNPADIASIEVLKDASATAIYGSRGANGVILISTQKGFDSSPEVTFSAQLGFAKAAKMPEVLNADEYYDFIRSANFDGYLSQPGSDPDADPDTISPEVINVKKQWELGYDTDWVDEVLKDKPAISKNYNLAIKGGTKDARYAASFGYYDEEGVIIANSNFKRYSFRLNSDYKLGKRFSLGENLVIAQMETKGTQTGNIWQATRALRTNPTYPVLRPDTITDPDDPLYLDPNDPNYEYNKYEGAIMNPVAMIHQINTLNQNLSIFGNVFAEATLLKGFKLRSSLGLNLSNSITGDFTPVYYLSPENSNDISKVTNSSYWTNGWLWENTLTYHRVLDEHTITAMAGYTSESNTYNYMFGSKQGTPTNEIEMRTLDAATTQPIANGAYSVNTMISMLGRINYSYGDRYLITASIRRDGSSKFGPGHKWGVFPSAAVGWKISNEGFFENLKTNLIPTLKLRAGWGQIGNTSMTTDTYNAYVSQIYSSPALRALIDNQPRIGYFFNVIGTPDLSWESTEQVNVGLDLGMFHNALTISTDYFLKTTSDMLIWLYAPGYAGYPASDEPWINAGKIDNRGFEFLIGYKGNSGKFSYDISANITTYKNNVILTNPDSADLWVAATPNLTRIGMPIGSFYGYVTDGIFQSMEEVQSYVDADSSLIQPLARPGDFRFKDLNGDGVIEAVNDQTFIGDPHPDFMFGFTINLGFRGFDLMTFWQGVVGNDLWNHQLYHSAFYFDGGNLFRDNYLDAWRGEGSSNTQPRLTTDQTNRNFRNSDFFVEDGSYLRMKIIQIGYTIPRELSRKLHLETCRIWIGGIDLITFTKYSGMDPEVALVHPLITGFDEGNSYPKTRKITVGINVSF